MTERSHKRQKVATDESQAEIVAEAAEQSLHDHPHPKENDELIHHDNGEFKGLVRHKTTAKDAERLEDGPVNPFTGEEFSESYFKILKVRRDLPVHAQREEFLRIFHSTQIMVFVGETGSGKTTQIPNLFFMMRCLI